MDFRLGFQMRYVGSPVRMIHRQIDKVPYPNPIGSRHGCQPFLGLCGTERCDEKHTIDTHHRPSQGLRLARISDDGACSKGNGISLVRRAGEDMHSFSFCEEASYHVTAYYSSPTDD